MEGVDDPSSKSSLPPTATLSKPTEETHSNSNSQKHIALSEQNKQQSASKENLNHREPSFTHDFVLISEFSELEGPVPLFIVPELSATQIRFNLNDFVLKIMAVDYQNKSTDVSK